VALHQPIEPSYVGGCEVENDAHAATWGAEAVEQGRFWRKMYQKVVGVWLGGGGRPDPPTLWQRRRDQRTSRVGARSEMTVRPAVGLLPRHRQRPKRCTSSPSPAEGMRLDLWPAVRREREREWPPLSCLDLKRMRVCEESDPSKQARSSCLYIHIVE
jgi:hypothetical protein